VTRIEIATRDGRCPSFVFHPAEGAPWPPVLVLMDGLGIRPAMLEIGERLAQYGYYTLVPDLFYRSGPYAPMDPRVVLSEPRRREELQQKFFALATPANIMSDVHAFLEYFATQKETRGARVGVTGYCLGGRMALIAAGTYPEEIVAAASYHGSRLATDAPDSPHLLAPHMRARLYIAGAVEDAGFPPQMKQRLADALSAAGVAHQIETRPARHGWVLRDTPAYDAAECEHHWSTLRALFSATLA
jgi:carboxymethylenebutenolidase